MKLIISPAKSLDYETLVPTSICTVPLFLSESKKIVNAITKCNPEADVTFTIIPGANHGSVENLFRKDEIYEWLFNQVKTIESHNEFDLFN